MTRKPQTPPVVANDIDQDAYYQVILGERAVLPHETLPARPEPYTMRGRMLKAVLASVESYAPQVD